AGKGVGGEVVWDADVAHLGVEKAVDDLAVHERSSADSGADGKVKEVGEAAPRAPAGLAGGGGIDVSVESDRDLQGAVKGRGEIVLLPSDLRSRGDEAESGRLGVKIDGAKGADADRAEFTSGLVRSEERRVGKGWRAGCRARA